MFVHEAKKRQIEEKFGKANLAFKWIYLNYRKYKSIIKKVKYNQPLIAKIAYLLILLLDSCFIKHSHGTIDKHMGYHTKSK